MEITHHIFCRAEDKAGRLALDRKMEAGALFYIGLLKDVVIKTQERGNRIKHTICLKKDHLKTRITRDLLIQTDVKCITKELNNHFPPEISSVQHRSPLTLVSAF